MSRLARAACARVIICRVRLRSVHPGDVVLANHKGRIFYARVVGHERAGVLRVEPLERNVTWRSVKAREVVDHWSHAAAGRDDRLSDAQLAFEGL
jgi:hypothetical protein